MADKPEAPKEAKEEAKDQAAREGRPEPSISLLEFARRNQTETVDGMPRPIRELMAGFVHEETAAGRRVGKVADFKERFAAFRTRKA